MASSYFQGGDFVELLSAQGKAPAAAWKLQGKIAKNFDKGIKGNAFQLNGGSETKMQLPKATSSSSLGLAQRFLVLQLLVPFTRSFSVEIGFADFQKVRRRFVVASAFRETTRTALHVQLPLNGADVPRDQWLSLVFDLQALSEAYFPDSGFRSMESLCVSGSCRVKRIFTMKDAPTPSPPYQGVRHADMREFPRQFAFSAVQRGTGRSGSAPIPTIYFVMTPTEDVTASSKDLAVTGTASNGVRKPVRRSQTAPLKTQSKPHPVVKGVRATRPMSGPPEPKIQAPSSPVAHSNSRKEEDKAIVSGQQRLRTPTPVSAPYSATGRLSAKSLKSPRFDELSSRSPMPASPVETVTSIHDDRAEVHGHTRSLHSGTLSSDERHAEQSDQADELETGEEEEPTDAKLLLSPVETVGRPLDDEQEPTEPVHHRSSSEKAGSAHSSVTKLSEPARRTIVGEIQRKLAMMEDDDERAIQRDQELFLRHTSLRSGEWHLRQLQDDELNPEATTLSEDEGDSVQLGASWRRELRETREGRLSPSPREKQRLSHEIEAVTSKWLPDAEKKRKSTIFSFPRSTDSEAAAVHRSIDQERSARLFDFDSLLQDIGSLCRPPDTVEVRASTSNEGISAVSNPRDMGNGVADDGANSDGEDAELTTLLAAKRSARRHQPHIQEQHQEEERPPLFHRSLHRGEESKDKVVEKEEASDAGMDVSDDKPVKRSRFVVHAHQVPDEAAVAQEEGRTTDAKEQHEQPGDGDAEDEEDEEDALSMDLTSDLDELSGSEEEEAEHDRQVRLEGDEEDDEGDDDKSFDFEDLVDAEEDRSIDGEEVRSHAEVSLNKNAPNVSADVRRLADRLEEKAVAATRSSSQGNQLSHAFREGGGMSLTLPEGLSPVTSPLLHPSRRKEARGSSQPRSSRGGIPALSSSFSSRRLQKLLESTDWEAELTAHATASRQGPSQSRTHESWRKDSRSRLPSSVRRSSKRPSTDSSSPARSASSASVELLYDPLLRCYFDPVANKYYALAE